MVDFIGQIFIQIHSSLNVPLGTQWVSGQKMSFPRKHMIPQMVRNDGKHFFKISDKNFFLSTKIYTYMIFSEFQFCKE